MYYYLLKKICCNLKVGSSTSLDLPYKIIIKNQMSRRILTCEIKNLLFYFYRMVWCNQ